ncbi:hypothetical protein Tco_0003856 [Tanacetum coccineum]
MLIYAKAPLFLWVEAVATKLDLSYLHVFGALCYPNNDSENLGKLQAKVDIVDFNELTTMASEQLSSGPGLHLMTPPISSSGLVTNPIPQKPCNPPKSSDFGNHFVPPIFEVNTSTPPTIAVSLFLVADAHKLLNLCRFTCVLRQFDQDAPSTSIH